MSIHVLIQCQLKPEIQDELQTFLKENLPNTRSFAGCLSVQVLFSQEHTQMLLSEEWSSPQHHQDYINHITHNGILGHLVSFLEEQPSISYFNLSTL